MQHFYQTISPDEDWFDFQGLYLRMVQTYDNANFVEVGSWKGRSASFLAVEIINADKNIKVYCVDTWEGSIEHVALPDVINKTLYAAFLRNIRPVKNVIIPLKMTSVVAAASCADGSLDFVFLDASHEYEDIKADIIAWLPKVKIGGTFAGHDIYFPGVDAALKELLVGKYAVEGNCFICQC